MKVAIVYGFAEGKWHGNKLRQYLATVGCDFTGEPAEADIIVAHSAGCFMLDKLLKARTILLVDPPLWPGRHPLRGIRYKVRQDTKDKKWFIKSFYNLFYACGHLSLSWHMNRVTAQQRWPKVDASRIVLVRNQKDVFSPEGLLKKIAGNEGWRYIELPGSHDDLWLNPAPYVDLLNL